jgi:hypothetical protein
LGAAAFAPRAGADGVSPETLSAVYAEKYGRIQTLVLGYERKVAILRAELCPEDLRAQALGEPHSSCLMVLSGEKLFGHSERGRSRTDLTDVKKAAWNGRGVLLAYKIQNVGRVEPFVGCAKITPPLQPLDFAGLDVNKITKHFAEGVSDQGATGDIPALLALMTRMPPEMVTQATRELEGRTMVFMALKSPKRPHNLFECFLDPARAYAVVKTVLYRADADVPIRASTVAYRDMGNDLWLPERVRVEEYSMTAAPAEARQGPCALVELTVTRLELNGRVDDALFEEGNVFSHGMRITDTINNTMYAYGVPVDVAVQTIVKESKTLDVPPAAPAPLQRTPLPEAVASPQGDPGPGPDAAGAGGRAWVYVLIAAALALGAGAAVLAFRISRRSREDGPRP